MDMYSIEAGRNRDVYFTRQFHTKLIDTRGGPWHRALAEFDRLTSGHALLEFGLTLVSGQPRPQFIPKALRFTPTWVRLIEWYDDGRGPAVRKRWGNGPQETYKAMDTDMDTQILAKVSCSTKKQIKAALRRELRFSGKELSRFDMQMAERKRLRELGLLPGGVYKITNPVTKARKARDFFDQIVTARKNAGIGA